MTDGQYFIYRVIAPETAVIVTGWAAWKRIKLARARTEWMRRIDARHKARRRRS